MNLLALDTSTSRASVALFMDGVFYSAVEEQVSEHARCLLPMMDALTHAHDLSQLDGIVFGRGPGSFTGLRIACSVAKGIAYAHDLPVFPVSGLAAMAYDVYQTPLNLPSDARVVPMIDARMNEVYWAVYEKAHALTLEQVTSAQAVVESSSAPLIIAGRGLDAYVEELSSDVRGRLIETRASDPDASTMIRLVLAGQVKSVTAAFAMPTYVRNQVTHGGVPHG
jgi:tRNA threonylcarbamoyladenosine biosynthesis protein TsaB